MLPWLPRYCSPPLIKPGEPEFVVTRFATLIWLSDVPSWALVDVKLTVAPEVEERARPVRVNSAVEPAPVPLLDWMTLAPPDRVTIPTVCDELTRVVLLPRNCNWAAVRLRF